MKITCQSCQSKYTVSDEKVQGKTVKIKCRKCGATILVNSGGVTTSAPNDVASASGGQDGGTSYLVNVNDGDQRSMTLAEIVTAYQSSTINAETYVWADGMGDWQPLGQVEAIVSALNSPSVPPAATSSPAAAAAPAAAAVAAEPEQRAAVRRDQARPAQDLFGAREEVPAAAPSYSNGAGAGRVPAPAPSGRSTEENSMLFSLSALTAKAATAPSAPAPKATTARDREDSGIIDLKALAASAAASQSSSASAAAPTAAAFLPDGGLFGAPIAAAPAAAPPVVTPAAEPPPKSKTPIFIGIGAVVALGAIVGAFMLGRGGPPPPPPAPAATETATAAPTATATAAPTTTASAEASAAPTTSASAEPSAVAKAGKGGGKAPAGKGAGAPAGKAAGAPGAAATPPPAAAPKKGGCGCAPGDLMCAMKCSAGK